ncbi:MAG: InlB B-repeat-containing protein, partial [Coriobacteriales bacterium]|nr:InlB B-repeat-containing protein [Coriobacteriales bacterium]
GGAFSHIAQASDTVYEIELQKDSATSVQSTIEIPIALNGNYSHGSSVYLLCTENAFGNTAGTLASPAALKNSSAGFALVANPEPTAANTVTNSFSPAYTPRKNATSDSLLFAALPSEDPLRVAQSTEGALKDIPLYISAKASPNTPTGSYLVRLRIDVGQNHTLDYDANGGEGSMDEIVATSGQDIVLHNPVEDGIGRIGYGFIEWNTAPDGSGTPYLPGDSFTIDDDSVLYAIWQPNDYELSFDKNAPDATVAVPDKEVTFDDEYGDLPVPTRPGYSFIDWNTAPDGTGDTIKGTDTVKTPDDQTVYAIWEPNEYTVSFEKNAADALAPVPATKPVVFASAYGPLATTTREGYTHTGWNTASDGTGASIIAESIVAIPNDHNLYARWQPNDYTLSFDLNGASGQKPDDMQVTYDGTYANLPEPTRAGYDFEGWNTDDDGSGDDIVDGGSVEITQDTIVYAIWTANTYIVTFNPNATGATVDPTYKEVTFGDEYGTLPVPARPGYSFVEWNTESSGTGDPVVASDTVETADDQTVYAKWTANAATVSFYNNYNDTDNTHYAAGDTANTGKHAGDTLTVPTAPTREGYSFGGWYTDRGATTAWDFGTDTVPLVANPTVDLYAKWTANTYTVTFEKNAGDATDPSPADKSVTYGSPYGDLPTTTRDDYEFKGWNTAQDGSGTTVTKQSPVATAANHTLYAQWAVPELEHLVFDVTTTAADEGFAIPTSGYRITTDLPGSVPYDWDIDWGDNTSEQAAGTGGAQAGIAHTYAQPGTYTIDITPHITTSPFQWARAFGFSTPEAPSDSALSVANRAKVVEVREMPARGYLASATATGLNYLRATWLGCQNLRVAAAPDVSGYSVSSIGNRFMSETWAGCKSLNAAVVPDTSNWQVTGSVGTYFMGSTWGVCGLYGDSYVGLTCASLETPAVPDTSNWQVTGISENFLVGTWRLCTSLKTALVPDTSNWQVTGFIGANFIRETWQGCTSLKAAVVPDTSNWHDITSIPGYFMVNTWSDCTGLTAAAAPDFSNWGVNGSIGMWFMRSTWQGCTNLQTAVVPDTSGWTVTGIGEIFMMQTWESCTKLKTAAVPDTSSWQVTSISSAFMNNTWRYCTSLATPVVPDTSGWRPVSIGHLFMAYTWANCSALTTLRMLDTSSWEPTSLGEFASLSPYTNFDVRFMRHTWYLCNALKDISAFRLGNGFKSIGTQTYGIYGGNDNADYACWYNTFYVTGSGYTGAQPTFYDGELITSLGTPSTGAEPDTFYGRTGMDDYTALPSAWK